MDRALKNEADKLPAEPQIDRADTFGAFKLLTDHYWRQLMRNRMKQWFFCFIQGWAKLNRKF
jgi:hypothetical protein